MFGKVNDAESSKGGYYFKDGTYRVKLQRVFQKEKRGGKVNYLIVETEILESNNPERPVGTKPSVMYGDDKDATPGNIKGFMGVGVAAMSCLDGLAMTPTQAEKEYLSGDAGKVEKFCEELVEEGALAGLELMVEAVGIKTKAGDDFTKIIWSVPNDTAAKGKAA
jgi:hypothetical protein